MWPLDTKHGLQEHRASGRTATCWSNKLTQGPLRGSSQAMDRDEDRAQPQWNATSCTLRDPTRSKFTMFYVLHDVCRKCPGYYEPRRCTRFTCSYVHVHITSSYYKMFPRCHTCSYFHVYEGRQRRLPTLRLEETLSSSSQYAFNGMVNHKSLQRHGTRFTLMPRKI
jgi:hypothetical protein